MRLCLHCLSLGYCRNANVFATTLDQVTPELVRDARNFTSGLKIVPGHWPEKLVNDYRDYRGRVLDRGTRLEIALQVELLYDSSEGEGELDPATGFKSSEYRTWYRDNLCRPAGKRVRIYNPARWRIVLTILRLRYSAESRMWGVRAANDNTPQPGEPPKCG